MATIDERLAILEKKVSLLEKAVKVTDTGTVVIAASNKVLIKAAVLEFEGGAAVLLKGATVEVSSAMNLVLKAVAVAQLQASLVRLNNGSRPVAYAGSLVVPQFPPMMKVDAGNGTVLV